jgi:hypothetical protein
MWVSCDDQGIGAERLRALTALRRLTVLSLYHVRWAEDAVSTALTMLAAGLPHLHVLNAPNYVLVRSLRCKPVNVLALLCDSIAEYSGTCI